MKKRFSIKGLADFMTSAPAKQRTIIRRYKYPHEDEARAKILYYREARDVVAAYHKAARDRAWLEVEASRVHALAVASPGRTRQRLEHNARAIREYARHFANRVFQVLDEVNLELAYGDVTITVRPDLHVIDNGKRKIVKLEFASEKPDMDVVKIISQGMFEAAHAKGMNLASAEVLYLDVPRGNEHKGARLGAKLRKDIAAACATISDIWASI